MQVHTQVLVGFIVGVAHYFDASPLRVTEIAQEWSEIFGLRERKIARPRCSLSRWFLVVSLRSDLEQQQRSSDNFSAELKQRMQNELQKDRELIRNQAKNLQSQLNALKTKMVCFVFAVFVVCSRKFWLSLSRV